MGTISLCWEGGFLKFVLFKPGIKKTTAVIDHNGGENENTKTIHFSI